MTATAPGRGLPARRFPGSGKSGNRKGFADKRETGRKQPTITQQKSSRARRLLSRPNHPFIPAEEREQLQSRNVHPQTREPVPPRLTSPLPPWKGSSSPSLNHSSSRGSTIGSPWVPWPRGSKDVLSSYSGTCCILFLRTRLKTSPHQRWALPARLTCRHRRPSHEPALAPCLEGAGFERHRERFTLAGRQGQRKLATSRDRESRRTQNRGCTPKLRAEPLRQHSGPFIQQNIFPRAKICPFAAQTRHCRQLELTAHGL